MVSLGCMTNDDINLLREQREILAETKLSDLRKYNQDIPEDVFNQITQSDLTYKPSNPDKAGKYAKWLLNLYRQDQSMINRLDKINALLQGFNSNNFSGKKLEELAQNDEQLSELLNNSDNTKSMSKDERFASDIKFNQDSWMIIVPSSFESSCYWAHYGSKNGAHSELGYEDGQWCTATPENASFYNYYICKGVLYINIDTKNKLKYQFHYETKSYKNGSDNGMGINEYKRVIVNGIPNSAVAWYEECTDIRIEARELITYEEAAQRLKNGENPKRLFDNIAVTDDGLTFVSLNGKCNVINTDGNLVSPKLWFDEIYEPNNEGFIPIEIQKKCNLIKTNGKILSSKLWFDDIFDFYEGFAKVLLNNKWNYIDTNGNLLSNQWFDNCGSFENGFGVVALNGKTYKIDTEGHLTER